MITTPTEMGFEDYGVNVVLCDCCGDKAYQFIRKGNSINNMTFQSKEDLIDEIKKEATLTQNLKAREVLNAWADWLEAHDSI